MNVLSIGFDLVDIEQLSESLKSDAFRHRVFTLAEINIAQSRRKSLECYAGKFAVKEAVMKCLGAGIQQGVWFSQIETLNTSTGQPILCLHHTALEVSKSLRINDWKITISHTKYSAGAVVLAMSNQV